LGWRGLAVGLGVLGLLGWSLAAAWSPAAADDQSSLGSRVYPAAYAIRGAKVVAAPGKVFDPGTIVVRRGVIEAVGPDKEVTVPYDAETIEGRGLVVYPGFIDLYTTVGQRTGVERSATGRGRLVDLAEAPLASTPADNRRGLTPEFEVAAALELADALAEPRRRLGFTDLLSAPAGAIATGQSALVSLSGLPRREAIIAAPVALHVNLAPPFEPAGSPTRPDANPPAPGPGPSPGRRRGPADQAGPVENPYPRMLMGSIAHLRQAMLDADHLRTLDAYLEVHGGPQPPFDPALQALQAARSRKLAVWWEANSRDEIHRALDLADEFGTSAVIVGGREAAKVADRLKAAKVPVVLRLNVPEEPKVPTEPEYRKKPAAEREEPLRVLAHRKAKWQELLATASGLAKDGIPFAFATDGVDRLESVPANLRQVIASGLKPDDALAALTKHAASIAGVDRRLGTLEPGKLGHVIALTAPFHDEKAKVRYVLVDGLKFEIKPEDRARAKSKAGEADRDRPGSREAAEKEKTKPAPGRGPETKKEEGRRPPERKDIAGQPTPRREPGQLDEAKHEEERRILLKKVDEAIRQEASRNPSQSVDPRKTDNETLLAEIRRELQDRVERTEKKTDASLNTKDSGSQAPKPRESRPETPRPDSSKAQAEKPASNPGTSKPAAPPFVDVATELDEDRKPALHTGGNVLIKDATILTVTKGTIPKGSILVQGGKIRAVGAEVKAPPGVTVIESAGLVAMPGIIDTHSHIAVQGGVNEMSLSVVPEVRVKDVVTGDDVAIYRALAGGTTTARLLHGSANTIGGQDAVVKLRYGKPGRDLIIRDGPQGVKFALGENVTRSPRRFPNTRMGVEAVIERAFEEARAYRAGWNAYRKAEKGGANGAGPGRPVPPPPPRVDLRLEALAGVLDGSIRIHSHCYRSDEILMLLRTAQKYGVRVQSLQHVLEGYKVAAEIAAHGASASTFSDWWAYKVEAFDAIPFNAALMTEAGVNVCIKSDDAELMRHLNLEAAKMVKYGAVSEAQALAMITINPARELGLADRLGSIEVGKDADLALFNAHPFDAFSRCELALIDGEVYFQRREPGGRPAARPGDHATMPMAPESARNRTIEVAAQPKGIFALVGANLHPIAGPEIKAGTLVVAGGRIQAVGPAGTPIPPEAQTIELSGLDVWPGLVDGGSTLGLFEVGSLSETQDIADAAQFQPELRSSTALRADSEHIPVTRANGILTSFIQPSGGLISGQGCVIDLHGWVPRELVIADEVALNVTIPTYIPRNPEARRFGPGRPGQGPAGGPGAPDPNERRKERLDQIKEFFRKALAYDAVVKKAHERGEAPPTPDPRLEAMVPYARGDKPVILHAEHPVEILDALELARERKLKAVLSGAAEGWKVAEAIAQAKVPVLLGGTLHLPRREHDPYDAAYTNAARLHAAGVTIAIRSQGGGPGNATAARNLPYEAATAVAFGLPEAIALQAVTIAPARILGIADQVGSLEAGKRANLVVTAGHLLQPTTPVLALFLDGEPIPPESRHTQLYAKYRRRLDLVRAGRARLGIEPVAGNKVTHQ
jgi:imidazolonepropionase-like amidohydrolase